MKENPLGLLPVEWRVERLGQVVERPQYGLTAGADQHPVGPKFLRITDIQDDRVHWADVPYCTCSEADKPKYVLREGDLVIARIRATTGKAFLMREDNDCAFASYLIRIRPKRREVSPEFLNQFTKTGLYWCQIDATKGGRLKQGVNIRTLQNVLMPIPPLREQQAIAYVLRTIQRAKEATENTIAAARQLKSSLMRHLFTYGPVPVGQAGQIPLQDSEFGQFPSHWQKRRLGELIASGPQNGLYKPESSYGSGTPIIRINDNPNEGGIVQGAPRRVVLTDAEVQTYSLAKGDLLINRVNSLSHIGKAALVGEPAEPAVYESNMMRFRVETKVVTPEYAFLCLCTPNCRDALRGLAKRAVAQSSVNQGDVKSLVIPVPPLEEQAQITSMMRAVEDKIQAEIKRSAAILALFSTLLDHLMTGKIRVGSLDLATSAEAAP